MLPIGKEIYYLHICRRKLWLFNHGIRPEMENDHVRIGMLTDDARRMILGEWDNELKKTIYMDSLNRSVSYRQLLRLDCYKLINFLLENRDYQPYKTRM